jgi:hypothetical protein
MGWFVAGYQFCFVFGKKKGHTELMKYADDKLKEKSIGVKLRQS